MTHDEAATYVFPDGQFAGLTVAQVAASDEGLLSLRLAYRGTGCEADEAILDYLRWSPDAAARLARLLSERNR
jgi:hypothetical protein